MGVELSDDDVLLSKAGELLCGRKASRASQAESNWMRVTAALKHGAARRGFLHMYLRRVVDVLYL